MTHQTGLGDGKSGEELEIAVEEFGRLPMAIGEAVQLLPPAVAGRTLRSQPLIAEQEPELSASRRNPLQVVKRVTFDAISAGI